MLQSVEDAAEGLAQEDRLFQAHTAVFCLWTAKARSIVCPKRYRNHAEFAAAAARSEKLGFPLHLRPTGGGAVPQGPGCINLALAFNAPTGFTLEEGYRWLTRLIVEALGETGEQLKTGDTPGSFCDGAWNLSAGQQKIVGTAQRWRPQPGRTARVLTHALILHDQSYAPGTKAVAAFHRDLGLPPIKADAHSSLAQAFGLTAFPFAAFEASAMRALSGLAPQPSRPD